MYTSTIIYENYFIKCETKKSIYYELKYHDATNVLETSIVVYTTMKTSLLKILFRFRTVNIFSRFVRNKSFVWGGRLKNTWPLMSRSHEGQKTFLISSFWTYKISPNIKEGWSLIIQYWRVFTIKGHRYLLIMLLYF